MSRKPKNESERKVKVTIRLKKKTLDRLREINNYNALIQDIVEKYLEKQNWTRK